MNTFLIYSIVQIVPDSLRGESMNIGLALHTPEGPKLHLHILPNRLKLLDPSLGGIDTTAYEASWQEMLSSFDDPQMKWQWLKTAMSPLVISPSSGRIYYSNEDDLTKKINAILQRMVYPLKNQRLRSKNAARRIDLNTEITNWLRKQHIFSRNMKDLTNNRVVSSFPLNLEEEMFAEFALKNGAIHVLETLDLRGHANYTKGLRNEASHKAMVLDVAEEALEKKSERLALVAADDYAEMKPAISLLNRKATGVLSMDSATDRQWLADFIAKALHLPSLFPPEDDSKLVVRPEQVAIANPAP